MQNRFLRTKCKIRTSNTVQGVVTPIRAMHSAATGVTICDRRNSPVTLWPLPKNIRDPVTTSKIHSAPVTCQAPFELWLAAERHGVCSISSAMWMWWGLVYEGHLHLQSLMRVVFVRAPAWLRQSCRNSAIPAVLLGRKAIQECAAVEHHNV